MKRVALAVLATLAGVFVAAVVLVLLHLAGSGVRP